MSIATTNMAVLSTGNAIRYNRVEMTIHHSSAKAKHTRDLN